MEMKTTKQIMVHNVKRAPNYWGKIRIFCFTTGPDEGPTGAETPLVAMLKEALDNILIMIEFSFDFYTTPVSIIGCGYIQG